MKRLAKELRYNNGMNNTFKVGDKVKRYASAMDSFWKEQCRRYNVEIDATFEVVSHHGAGAGVQLKGLEPGYGYTLANFKLVEFAKPSEETKMKEAYELAKSLFGKTVECDDGTKYTVTGVIFRQDKTDNLGLGAACGKFLKDNGWVIGVKFNGMNYPVQRVKEVPADIDIKLNGGYTATVSKGSVKVGCQTFPIEKIQEIIDAYNKL